MEPERFDCLHCDKYGFCRLYSNLEADVPCKGDGDCDGYVEVDNDDA